jgi:hypothetical protein
MDITLLNVFLVVLLISFVPVIFVGVRTYLRYRGTRVVTCPETNKPVAVHVNEHLAASTALEGETQLRLTSCTRWPEREHCGQECLSQIEASPEGCLVRNMAADWYAGRSCYFCSKEFGIVRWTDNQPALLTPDLRTIPWNEVPPESLPSVFATHQPVCWTCSVAKTFHDRFPELVTERRPRSERQVS